MVVNGVLRTLWVGFNDTEPDGVFMFPLSLLEVGTLRTKRPGEDVDLDLNEIVEFVVGIGGGLGDDGVTQRGDGTDADIVPVVAHHAVASEIVVGARGFVAGVDGGGSDVRHRIHPCPTA